MIRTTCIVASAMMLGIAAPAHAQCCPTYYYTQWGSLGSGDGQFYLPYAVTTDDAGDVYVVDTDNWRIQKFTGNGAYLFEWGSYGSGNGQFAHPTAMAIDAAGDVYVADRLNNRIQKFTSAGAYHHSVAWALCSGGSAT